MQKQILSAVLALSTVLLSALPSSADTTTNTPIKIENLQPTLSQPFIVDGAGAGIIDTSDTHRPGSGGGKPKPKPGPPPPRREDPILLNEGIIFQPRLNTQPQHLKINQLGARYELPRLGLKGWSVNRMANPSGPNSVNYL